MQGGRSVAGILLPEFCWISACGGMRDEGGIVVWRMNDTRTLPCN